MKKITYICDRCGNEQTTYLHSLPYMDFYANCSGGVNFHVDSFDLCDTCFEEWKKEARELQQKYVETAPFGRLI